MNLPPDAIEAAKKAVVVAWNKDGDAPFPFYDREVEVVATAALTAALEKLGETHVLVDAKLWRELQGHVQNIDAQVAEMTPRGESRIERSVSSIHNIGWAKVSALVKACAMIAAAPPQDRK